jgi:hypothetical protein
MTHRKASSGRTEITLLHFVRQGRKRETNVMDDMIVGDIVKEKAALPAQERPVDGSGCSPLEVPLLATIMRHDRVSVVQVGDHDD